MAFGLQAEMENVLCPTIHISSI